MRAFSESDEKEAESDAATSAPQTTSSEEVLLIDAFEDKVDEDWSALGFKRNVLTVGTAICTCKHASLMLLALIIKRLPLKDFDRLPTEIAVRASLRCSEGLSNPAAQALVLYLSMVGLIAIMFFPPPAK